jgi:potassium-transporting ATPase KdpC subunit
MILSSLKGFLFFTALTGFFYPLLITGIAQVTMKGKANGSFIEESGKRIGSELIAQKFERPDYFHPRPSAIDYNPLPSGGSNLGPASTDLKQKFEERKNAGASGSLLFASGSGLDPDIRPEDARAQILRVVSARRLDPGKIDEIAALVEANVIPRDFKVFGEERVNILQLNWALEKWITAQNEEKAKH